MDGLGYLQSLTDEQLKDIELHRDWLTDPLMVQALLCPDMLTGIKKSCCVINGIKCPDCVEAWLKKEVEYEQ